MDLLEQIKALEADKKASEELLTSHASTVTEKENEITALKESLATKQASEQEALSKFADLQAAFEALKEEKETLAKAVESLKAEAKSAEDLALEKVASLGISTPIKVDVEEASALTKEEAVKAYNALLASDSTKAAAFYSKHRGLILG